MSDNPPTDESTARWQGADLVTVNGFGTVADIMTATVSDGRGVVADLRALWLEDPENLVAILAAEVIRRDAEYENLVQLSVSENAGLSQSLLEAERITNGLTEAFDHFEEHYHLALAVVEAVRAYVAPENTDVVPALFGDLTSTLAAFDGFDGPVQVDAIAGDRVAVSAVPPYQGGEDDGEEEVHSRPNLSIVPDQE